MFIRILYTKEGIQYTALLNVWEIAYTERTNADGTYCIVLRSGKTFYVNRGEFTKVEDKLSVIDDVVYL